GPLQLNDEYVDIIVMGFEALGAGGRQEDIGVNGVVKRSGQLAAEGSYGRPAVVKAVDQNGLSLPVDLAESCNPQHDFKGIFLPGTQSAHHARDRRRRKTRLGSCNDPVEIPQGEKPRVVVRPSTADEKRLLLPGISKEARGL